ncbi:Homogentisate 1,2-dioxygenase [Gorgonomyces haynaldii]|nr:Homogentisate 1,2-dioxygenase [Gorgonomyces haynaldii]
MEYNQGYGNYFETEALEGALPRNQNAPQKVPYGLYAEQLSGTAFTAQRKENQKSWLYRIRPSVGHEPFKRIDSSNLVRDFSVVHDHLDSVECESTPQQLRWSPFEIPTEKRDFVQGLHTVMGAGSPGARDGLAVHVYLCNTSMGNKAMYNADGDFLFVPQEGQLTVKTEMGRLQVKPGEIMIIPRGIRFSIDVEGPTRGYICEIFFGHFEIPDLGPIGANGLADPRHFLYPKAWYEDLETEYTIVSKYQGYLFQCTQNHSPFDVVAWHGNYSPCKYDLSKFNTINTVSFDHLDPSIFTVLTAKSAFTGTALCDFVIFPPRWTVAENTFRPPWFHRNCMSEFMGLIHGQYDAKADGFLPGGGSLHSMMTPHGPDRQVFEKASTEQLKPIKISENSLAFMFESYKFFSVSKWALHKDKAGGKVLQQDYYKCWQNMGKYFDAKNIKAGPQ